MRTVFARQTRTRLARSRPVRIPLARTYPGPAHPDHTRADRTRAEHTRPDASGTDYIQTAVTPHASFLALTALPQQAMANIDRMLSEFPQVMGPYGFYDSLDPVTGAVGHRCLDLDQSMIMAALDDVLSHGALQRRWAADQVGRVDLRYLRAERFSVAPEQ
ncbi:MAG TPA: glucoamylase family protein [Streptosporangiaceae bacterium]|jgi:hypothetical protein